MSIRKEIRNVLIEQQLSEISDHLADAALQVGISYRSEDANKIFGNKKRIVVDFQYEKEPFSTISKEMENLGYEVDFGNSIARKTVQTKVGPKVREMSLDKALKKEADSAYKSHKKEGGKVLNVDDFLKGKTEDELLKIFERPMGVFKKILENDSDSKQLAKICKIKPGVANFLKFIVRKIKTWDDNQAIEKKMTSGRLMRELGFDYTRVKTLKDYLNNNFLFAEHHNGQMQLPAIFSASKDLEQVGSGFQVVISRASIDVLRMSDWKHLQSCHSDPNSGQFKKGEGEDLGGSYFHCAVEESKNGGIIAFLVQKKDIEGVDIQKEELFSDKSRGVSGVVPKARLRLRGLEYEVSKSEERRTMVVPETQSYGLYLDAFYDNMKDWAIKSQRDQLSFDKEGNVDGVIDAKAFHLMGGSYNDTAPDQLLQMMVNKEYHVSKSIDITSMFEVVEDFFMNKEQEVKIAHPNKIIFEYEIPINGDPKLLSQEEKESIKMFKNQFKLTMNSLNVFFDEKIKIVVRNEIDVDSNDNEETIMTSARSFVDFCDIVEDASYDLDERIEGLISDRVNNSPGKRMFRDEISKKFIFHVVAFEDEMKFSNIKIAQIKKISEWKEETRLKFSKHLENGNFIKMSCFSGVDHNDFTSIKIKIGKDGSVVLDEMYVAYPESEEQAKKYISSLVAMKQASKEIEEMIGE